MIPLFKVHMPPEADAAMLEVLHSGYVGQGRKVDEFDRRLTEMLQAPVATVNSGTAAIVLALRLAGVGPGDKVITTPMTCTATNLPILQAGAEPLFADVDPATGLIDPASVRLLAQMHPDAKAVVCVDWGGLPVEVDAMAAATKPMWPVFGDPLPVIEDAAHALGARLRGRPVGARADFTCLSFQAIKHVTTVDGGALACLDPADHHRAKLLRWYGIDREAEVAGDSRIDVDIMEWGYKAHMNDVAAALGLTQLPHLPRILAAQRANAEFYHGNLPRVFGRPPYDDPEAGTFSAWWLYTVFLPGPEARAGFRSFMLSKGIQVSQVHRRNDEYTVFRPFAPVPGSRPGLDAFSSRMVCLPVHWGLGQEDLDAIVDGCREFAGAGAEVRG